MTQPTPRERRAVYAMPVFWVLFAWFFVRSFLKRGGAA